MKYRVELVDRNNSVVRYQDFGYLSNAMGKRHTWRRLFPFNIVRIAKI